MLTIRQQLCEIRGHDYPPGRVSYYHEPGYGGWHFRQQCRRCDMIRIQLVESIHLCGCGEDDIYGLELLGDADD